PDEFRKGGNRVCVPMIAGGELLGVMTLGDRVGAVAYSLQDFDLLKSVSDQAAASLLNIQLSQKLWQAKQLEAFQAMSAFFVHDLKNTASTLSLMLQNLPVHFNDPKFREDALRGISKTVTHINDLIGRLSLLRQELAVQPVDSDLNELVMEALEGEETGDSPEGPGFRKLKRQSREVGISQAQEPGASRIEVQKELRALPKVRVDPIQIRNVITNLVLNAREAVGVGGQIRVETS